MQIRKNARKGKGWSGDSRRRVLLAGAAVFGLGAAAWAFSGGGNRAAEIKVTPQEAKEALGNLDELNKLPAEERKKALFAYGKAITSDFAFRSPEDRKALKAPPQDGKQGERPDGPPPSGMPGAPDEKIRQAMDKLSPEDREALRRGMDENMHKAFEKMMSTKIDAFFKATPEEQEKLLQEEVERMKSFEERRKKDETDGKKDDKRRGPPVNESKDQHEQHMRGMLDTTSPDERARRDEYFSRVRATMEASKK